MTNVKQTIPGQDKDVGQAKDAPLSTRDKEKRRATGSRDEDLPGAEGPLSAGANEDTYD